MNSPLWSPVLPWGHLILRVSLVYIVIVLLLRLGGKKQVGQLGTAELVALLLISNAVQNAMNGGDNSLVSGLALAGILVGWSVLFSYLGYKSKFWEGILQGRPTLLIHHGEILHKSLERERLNMHDLHAMLRQQGIQDIHPISEAVLESNGALSVVMKPEPRRRQGR